MSNTIDMTAPVAAIVIDRGGYYVSTWTLPGTGDLTGAVVILVEETVTSADVVTFAGTITSPSARTVEFTFSSAATALLTGKFMRYSCRHTVGAAVSIVAKGDFIVRDVAE